MRAHQPDRPEAVSSLTRPEASERLHVGQIPPPEFDRLTQQAAHLLGASLALLSLNLTEEETIRSAFGLPSTPAGRPHNPLIFSLCQHVARGGAPVAVENATSHPLLRTNPALSGLGIQSYLGVPLRTAEGKIIGSLCIAETRSRNWTEREIETVRALADYILTVAELRAARQIQEEQAATLQRAQQSAVRTEKMASLGEMVAGVAHEINNPLAAISGTAQLLALHPDATVRTDAASILHMVRRATRIVGSLKTFARQGSDMEARIGDLSSIVSGALNIAVPLFRQCSITIETDLAENLPLVLADEVQIEQVVINLLQNARDAIERRGDRTGLPRSEEQGIVLVRTFAQPVAAFAQAEGTGKAGPFVCFSISDNGCGMEESVRKRIFDPFFTTKEIGEGTGLGLSICHSTVARHGGSIAVETTVGGGTTFTVSLPATAE